MRCRPVSKSSERNIARSLYENCRDSWAFGQMHLDTSQAAAKRKKILWHETSRAPNVRLRQYELKDRNRRKKKYATDQLDRNFRVITAHNKQQSNEQTNKTVETRLTLAGTSRGSFIRLSHASWSANGSEGKKKTMETKYVDSGTRARLKSLSLSRFLHGASSRACSVARQPRAPTFTHAGGASVVVDKTNSTESAVLGTVSVL